MSTQSSNIDGTYYSEVKRMYEASQVARLHWDDRKGEALKRLRGKMSRRELSERLVNCSHQYIQKLEEGHAESITPQLLEDICAAIGIESEQIIPAVKIQLPK